MHETMRFVDLSASARLPLLMEMVSSLSRAGDAREVMELCVGGMQRLYGSRCYLLAGTRGLPHGHYRITRLLTRDGVDHVAAQHDGHAGEFPIHKDGCIGEIIASPVPRLAYHLDLAGDPVLGDTIADYHSLVAVPIFSEGEAGDWTILLDTAPEGFTLEELEELVLRANLVGAVANNLRIAQQLISANLRIQQEVEHIAVIQRSLLPQDIPQVAGLSVAASYEACEQAGGDMYDILPLEGRHRLGPDPRCILFIGDVSGHGPSAAVVMAMVHAILHSYCGRPEGPAEILRRINAHLCAQPMGDSFVTAFLALYDPPTRRLSYARAGHPPPLLMRSNEGDHWLDRIGDAPLGIEAQTTYAEDTITLSAGDILVLYTDGITDARDPEGRWFGAEGLRSVLLAAGREPRRLVEALAEAVRRHQQGAPPRDDQTIVVVRSAE